MIRDLLIRCIIGINPEERVKKQDVVIDVTLYADLSEACATDDIEKTVNYSGLKKSIVSHVEESEYLLIERLAQVIADICLADRRVHSAKVSVRKPGALRFARTVGVEITRHANHPEQDV